MAYGFTYTLPTVSGSHTDFPWVITEGKFPSAAVDGGASSVLNGGGNLRAYTDDTKATQLPIEVVEFVTGGSPSVVVWVKIPTAETGSTIYFEADEVATTQPAVTATYGRNAVWAGDDVVYHLEDDPSGTAPQMIDSTGNGDDLTSTGSMTSGDSVSAVVGNGVNFDGVNDRLENTSYSGGVSSNVTISVWVNPDNIIDNKYISSFEFEGAANRRALIYGYQDGHVNVFNNGAYPTESATDTQMSAPAGSFSHVVYTANGTTLRGYVDGVEIVNVSANLDVTGLDYLAVGGSTTGNYFGGSIDEYKISSVSRAATWIETEHLNQSSPGTIGTSSEWEDSAGGPTYTLALDSASFTTTAQDADLLASRKLTAGSASYVTTAYDAALAYGRRLVAESASYATTAQDVELLANRVLSADSAGYTTTAQSADLLHNKALAADSASYQTNAQDVGLSFVRVLTAESASYTTTAQDAGLLASRVLAADTASYTTTAFDAALVYTPAGGPEYTLVAEQASYNTNAQDAGLKLSRILTADAAVFNATAYDAGLYANRVLTADYAQYTTTAFDAGIIKSYLLTADTANYTTTAFNADLVYSGAITGVLTAKDAAVVEVSVSYGVIETTTTYGLVNKL